VGLLFSCFFVVIPVPPVFVLSSLDFVRMFEICFCYLFVFFVGEMAGPSNVSPFVCFFAGFGSGSWSEFCYVVSVSLLVFVCWCARGRIYCVLLVGCLFSLDVLFSLVCTSLTVAFCRRWLFWA
jgi:hypothetical protein